MNRSALLLEFEDLRTVNNWYNIKNIHDIPEMYLQSISKHFKRLNPEEQRKVWDKIISEYRSPHLPPENYIREMVGMYLNDVIPARKDRSKYEKPTEQEKAEAAQAAKEACANFDKLFTMLYEDDETLLKNKEEEERKRNVKTHREKHMQMVKLGMVELTTPETLHQRAKGNAIWIKKSEAIAQGLSEENGDFKCHRERFVKEVNSFGRIGR